MVENNENSPPAKQSSLVSLKPTRYVVIGSIVLIGLFNMYKGLFRFSYGFIAGTGIGIVLGFVLADSSIGQYILKQRSKSQQS
jgi:hypothetical protein